MARFGAWVKKHFRPKTTNQKNPELPFLDNSRRPITPTTFETQTSLLFNLPYEIREIILLIVLDGCGIHMDLVHRKEGWKWRGAICHRSHLRVHNLRYCGPGLWNDQCLTHFKDDGDIEPMYKLGIMGFLLSCKQGYAEGIHMLYSVKYIQISSQPLLLHLPQLVPAVRLGSITTMEVVVKADRIEQDSGSPSFSFDHLEPILENIRKHCHHLRSLYLSFLTVSVGCRNLDGPSLATIDAFYHSTRLRDLRIELPDDTYYRKLRTHEPEISHPREAPITGPFKKSKWRALDGVEPSVQWRSIERYPYPPLKMPLHENGDEDVESAGYWLLEGDLWGKPVASVLI